MFDGVKILCFGPLPKEKGYGTCLQPVIVPEDKFLKIANLNFKCPKCGREIMQVNHYFENLMNLRQVSRDFLRSSFYVRNYQLAFEICHEDGFDTTAHVLENDDWESWNMQISAITIANKDTPGYRIDIWEDHFLKGRPYVYPLDDIVTFSDVLSRDSFYLHGVQIDLNSLQSLVKEIRNYNSAYLQLVDSFLNSAPADLEHPVWTHLNQVDSLAELFPETYE